MRLQFLSRLVVDTAAVLVVVPEVVLVEDTDTMLVAVDTEALPVSLRFRSRLPEATAVVTAVLPPVAPQRAVVNWLLVEVIIVPFLALEAT